MRILVMIGLLWIICSGTGTLSIAAEKTVGPPDGKPVEAPSEQPPELAEGPLRRRLETRLHGSTPEEQARLNAERQRLSGQAASFGVDPTAIVGFYQLLYGHNAFTNNLRSDSAAPTVRLPITPNWLFQVTMPYVWADLNQSNAFPLRGAGDMTTRTGGRVFANEYVAVFVGFDALFPTASEKQLGTGKYTLGPGGALAVPLPRMRSQFNLVAQDYNSVGGDPSRADLHFTQIQPAFYTFWTDQFLTGAVMTWDIDWEHQRKTAMNLLGQVGYRFDNHWVLFAGPGVGVVGRDTFLGLDWTVQAGVRWMFKTPLFSERMFDRYPRE
jgi:hypothetical protein